MIDRGLRSHLNMIRDVMEKTRPGTAIIEACPMCLSTEKSRLFSTSDRLLGVPGEFSYSRCTICSTVFQDPMIVPEDLHLCYPDDYAPYGEKIEEIAWDLDSLPETNYREKTRKAIVETVKGKAVAGVWGTLGRVLAKSPAMRERAFYYYVDDACIPRGPGLHRALDLGCGSGHLLHRLETIGWTADGVEWNERAAAFAREATGCSVWTGDFRNIDLPKDEYELVFLNHVFEHLSDPNPSLVRIRDLLRKGGRAVLLFPNPRSIGAVRHKENWYAWEAPRHLILPSAKALRTSARRAGFTSVSVKSRAYRSDGIWARSNAHRLGRDAENDLPGLTLSDKVGLFTERVAAGLGFDAGWETVAVLTK